MAISPTRDGDRSHDPDAADSTSSGTATDGGTESASSAGPDATADEGDLGDGATATAESPLAENGWVRRYLREHTAHALVIAFFAIYPPLYGVLLRLPGIDLGVASFAPAAFFDAFLPGTTFVISMLFLGLFAMSFDFISGYTGYLSFGHAAFYGIGAYFIVLVANGDVPFLPEGTPFVITMLLGAILAFLAALAIGAVSFRLTGVYFAMITLGFAQVLYELIRNWGYVAANPQEGPNLGGPTPEIGVPYVDSLSVALGRLAGDSFENVLGLGIDVSATLTSYYAIGLVVVCCYFAMQRIIHSPFGRVMIAIRENEERARAVGYNVFWYKMAAFGFSGFFAAIAGALFAAYSGAASPDTTFYFLVTADALIVAIIGGLGTLAGPFFGSAFFEWLEDVLSSEQGGLAPYLREGLPESVLEADVGGVSFLEVINGAVDGRSQLYLGIVFVLFVLFVPNGLLGSVRDRIGGPVAKRLPDYLDRYRR
ncbi:amino acid/amide ABC transporter membrane protein 2, HAAT family [Halobiforma haloterrestris]|uniref:Amino acid/amide ABC transporter membrane protein 2, HAAT family n=1 Tax=Natronobacterium haloterrestre TaxID=148448 RepID=A0A1I1FEI6_NATHA|nr:branched-chain amino acid ABC transporter permease [Halobiforma haloterrestris]SFB97785.1 amino acid/amide ABC transporter membrane protein 2, HAAT family [Halobiforma haloterrestris]